MSLRKAEGEKYIPEGMGSISQNYDKVDKLVIYAEYILLNPWLHS